MRGVIRRLLIRGSRGLVAAGAPVRSYPEKAAGAKYPIAYG